MSLSRLGLIITDQPATAPDVNDELDNILDHINGANITASNVTAGALTSACFTDNTLDGVKLLAASVAAAKLVANSLAGGAAGQIALATLEHVNMKTGEGFVRVATGTYAGDNAPTRAITGLGFQPDLVLLFARTSTSNGGAYRLFAKSQHDSGLWSINVSSGIARNSAIKSLDADGFTVSDTPDTLNDNRYTYAYFAFVLMD